MQSAVHESAEPGKVKWRNYPCVVTTSIILFVVGGCTACGGFLHPVAESFVSVQGKIADVQAGSICRLDLYREKGQSSGQMTIAPEFKRSLVIAPGVHKYYLEVSCDGHAGKFRSGIYELGVRRALYLGTIFLRAQ